jgi:type IV pilus assembly protein PilE
MTTVQTSRRAGGFTLIELMVTVVIATILLTIAIPTYQSQIRKTRRTEARTAMLDLANREERYFSVNNAYTTSQQALGYSTTTTTTTFSQVSVGSGYYTVTITTTTGSVSGTTVTQPGYSIVATSTGTQAKDTDCATFTVNEKGTQSSTNAAASDSTSTCWH